MQGSCQAAILGASLKSPCDCYRLGLKSTELEKYQVHGPPPNTLNDGQRWSGSRPFRAGGFSCSTPYIVVHAQSLVTKMVRCKHRGVFIWSTLLRKVQPCTLSEPQPESFTAPRYG